MLLLVDGLLVLLIVLAANARARGNRQPAPTTRRWRLPHYQGQREGTGLQADGESRPTRPSTTTL